MPTRKKQQEMKGQKLDTEPPMFSSNIAGIMALSPQTKYESGNFNSEFTTGGDTFPIERLNITDKVLDQSDKSLNRKLWESFPVNKHLDDIKKMGQEAMVQTAMAMHMGNANIAELLPVHARDQRAQLFIIIYGVCSFIEGEQGSLLASVMQDIAVRKAKNRIDPIATVVAEVEAKKDEANDLFRSINLAPNKDRRTVDALIAYIRALLALAPWYASPLVFSGKQAFDFGIAQLQSALLLNIAIACQYLGDADPRFYRKAMQFASLIIEMRYVKHKTLMKAIQILNSNRNELCRIVGESPGAMPRIVQETLTKMEAKAADGWAHENCRTAKHEGCM
jgi:hypothetical protein